MKKCNVGRIVLITLLVCNLGVLGCVGHITYHQTEFISILENKIDILVQHQEEMVKELTESLLSVIKFQSNLVSEIDYLQTSSLNILRLIEVITEEIKKMQDYQLILKNQTNNYQKEIRILKEYQKILEKKINSKKDIDLENVKKIKEANVLIKNLTLNCLGSGTHIKINGEDYVLTCGHLIEGEIEDNAMVIVSDFGTWTKAEIVKYNKEKDLALLKTPQLKNTAYLEIATEAPKEGSEITVVGNPAGIIDMITDGIIAKIDRKGYSIVTAKGWFGNSGGSLLYRGKIVGVMIQLLSMYNLSTFGVATQNYSRCVSLSEIKTFLGEPNYEPKSNE